MNHLQRLAAEHPELFVPHWQAKCEALAARVELLESLVLALADRCAGQSELLSKWAERRNA